MTLLLLALLFTVGTLFFFLRYLYLKKKTKRPEDIDNIGKVKPNDTEKI